MLFTVGKSKQGIGKVPFAFWCEDTTDNQEENYHWHSCQIKHHLYYCLLMHSITKPSAIPNNSFRRHVLTCFYTVTLNRIRPPTRFCIQLVTGGLSKWDVQKSQWGYLWDSKPWRCLFLLWFPSVHDDDQRGIYCLLCPNITDTTLKSAQM